MAIVDFPRAAAALEWLSPLSMASLFFFLLPGSIHRPRHRAPPTTTRSPFGRPLVAFKSPISRLLVAIRTLFGRRLVAFTSPISGL